MYRTTKSYLHLITSERIYLVRKIDLGKKTAIKEEVTTYETNEQSVNASYRPPGRSTEWVTIPILQPIGFVAVLWHIMPKLKKDLWWFLVSTAVCALGGTSSSSSPWMLSLPSPFRNILLRLSFETWSRLRWGWGKPLSLKKSIISKFSVYLGCHSLN